jgi:small-conductance mechanosensitive channel
MSTLETLKSIFSYPLARLSGTELTLASLLTALLVVLAGLIVARVAGRAAERVLARRGLGHGAQFAMGKIVRYLLTLLAVFVGVTTVGIKLDAVLAASTVLLVGVGFGLQNVAQNFISGLILLVERPVAKGDFVRIGTAHGSVVDIGLRATRIVTRDEVTIIVPNSQLITEQVVNHSSPSDKVQIEIKVGVAYGTDPERVREVLMGVAEAVPEILGTPVPEVRLDNFGDSSLDFSLHLWVADPRHDERVGSNVRFAIAAAFAKAKIEIPFPQRELHIRSAVDGETASRKSGDKAISGTP